MIRQLGEKKLQKNVAKGDNNKNLNFEKRERRLCSAADENGLDGECEDNSYLLTYLDAEMPTPMITLQT